MCVIGEECCDGSSRSSEPKDDQYFCSAVRVEGPLGSFMGCRGWTSAAIVGGALRRNRQRRRCSRTCTLRPNFFWCKSRFLFLD
jgi:hypothetical protein